MAEQESHTMQQVGEDDFECPQCGRFIHVTNWNPFRFLECNPGNANAIHTASTGGLVIGGVGLSVDDDNPEMKRLVNDALKHID